MTPFWGVGVECPYNTRTGVGNGFEGMGSHGSRGWIVTPWICLRAHYALAGARALGVCARTGAYRGIMRVCAGVP